MKSVTIDRSKRLREQPETGHNRWHPDIPPILEVDPGEEVLLETRDARDGQIHMGTTLEDLASQDKKSGHPLTGPIFIKGAQPGDLLEIEYVDIVPQPYGWTRFYEGAGFLRDAFKTQFLAHWTMTDRWATSKEIPGVRIPEASFMGTAGLAPSHAQLREWTRREAALHAKGGWVNTPDALDAVPPSGPIASEGVRTTPPRENCGNLDAKQLTRGSKLFIPVSVAGGLYSTGDAHYAQGDGEVCVSAIEMGATVTVRFQIHEQKAARDNIRWPRFSHSGYFAQPEWAVPRGFIATIGMPIRDDGTQENGDITLAARNALLQMIELLQERGFSREQAYVICSVAVDLRISNAVNYPNLAVSALLPEAIFVS
jgi:formamidase